MHGRTFSDPKSGQAGRGADGARWGLAASAGPPQGAGSAGPGAGGFGVRVVGRDERKAARGGLVGLGEWR